MSDLFHSFRVRKPGGAPVAQIVGRGISTHPAGTTALSAQQVIQALLPPSITASGNVAVLSNAGTAATARVGAGFHDALRAAYDTRDLMQFSRIAGTFYTAYAIRKLSDLKPIARAAYTLFKTMGRSIDKTLIDRFFAQQGEAAIAAYVGQGLADDLDRTADSILAAEALGLHATQRDISLTQLLRSLCALQIAHALRARDRDAWSIAPLVHLFAMPIYLPGWVWCVDPCDCGEPGGDHRGEVVYGPAGASPGGGLQPAPVGGVAPPANAGPVLPGGAGEPRNPAAIAASPLLQKIEEVRQYHAHKDQPAKEGDCDCDCDDPCVPPSPCCIEFTPFIADLMVVRHTLRCYYPSEIASISNAAAGEKWKRKRTNVLQTKRKQETDTTVTATQQLDHQEQDTTELTTEVQRTIDTSLSLDAGVTADWEWGSASLNASYSTSTSLSDSATQQTFKSVVNHAVLNLARTVREQRSTTTLNRTVETNTHKFDRTGQDLSVGIYTWVDEEYEMQAVKYDRCLTLRFVMPDPGARYRALLQRAFGLDVKFDMVAPTAPPPASAINDTNYLALASQYGVDGPPRPPEKTKTISQHVGGDYGGETHSVWSGYTYSPPHTQFATFSIPAGYVATTLSGNPTNLLWNGHTGDASVGVHIGSPFLQWAKNGSIVAGPVGLPPLEGQIQATVDDFHMTSFGVDLHIVCTLKPEAWLAWQAGVHKQLQDAYDKQKETYDAALAAFEAAQAEKKQKMQDFLHRDPFVNGEVQRTELQAEAIEMLMCLSFDRFQAMNYRVQPCGLPQIDRREAEEKGKLVRFIEEAFAFSRALYVYYPYQFDGRLCGWQDKVTIDTGDALFDKFLQAGAVQYQVAVTKGFEADVQYFLQTGQIWGQDGEPPNSDTDADWISLIDEIKHQQDCYFNDREGLIDTNPPSDIVTIKGSDRYWDALQGTLDNNAIAADLKREISFGGDIYQIVAITLNANSPPFDLLNPDQMWWDLTIKPAPAGAPATGLPYAVGGQFIGAPWRSRVPTSFVWLVNDTYCLPCYPITCTGG
ncbi:MAG: hypothetical protein E6G97_05320 [Alphaproteobacteria bacterium]|nr:MAG: hypothetical protein E6G97_05320 [Alphaproteobacteria bacterium]